MENLPHYNAISTYSRDGNGVSVREGDGIAIANIVVVAISHDNREHI